MLVRAIKAGYHKNMQEVGSEFDVPEGQVSPWWVPVDVAQEETPRQPIQSSFSEMNAHEDSIQKERMTRRSRREV